MLFSENHPRQKASSTLAHSWWGLRGVQQPGQHCGLLQSITRGPACPWGPSAAPHSFPIRPLSLSGFCPQGHPPPCTPQFPPQALPLGNLTCWHLTVLTKRGGSQCGSPDLQAQYHGVTSEIHSVRPRLLTCRPTDPETLGERGRVHLLGLMEPSGSLHAASPQGHCGS